MRASEGFRIGDGSLARHRGLFLASQHPPANEPLPGHPGGGFALGAALDASDLAQRTPLTSLRYLVAYQGSSDALGITEGAGPVFSNQEHERRPPPCREATADRVRARQRLCKRRAMVVRQSRTQASPGRRPRPVDGRLRRCSMGVSFGQRVIRPADGRRGADSYTTAPRQPRRGQSRRAT
jgi:hypothetical protein